MTSKVYRTARGKTVDLGALELQNEAVRAVGNMGVNARGDKVDPSGGIVQSRNVKVSQANDAQSTNVSDAPVPSSHKAKKAKATAGGVESVRAGGEIQTTTKVKEVSTAPQVVASEDPTITPSKPQLGGLAAAIAASKTVKQEAMKTPRQETRDTPGVQKI